MTTKPSYDRGNHRSWKVPVILLALVAVVLAGCGDDDDQTAQERYCESGDSLRSSVEALLQIDVVSGGTDAVEEGLDQVFDDVENLKENASEAAADEVDALEDTVDAAQDALADLGGDINADNASAVVSSVAAIETSVTAVYDTLADCG